MAYTSAGTAAPSERPGHPVGAAQPRLELGDLSEHAACVLRQALTGARGRHTTRRATHTLGVVYFVLRALNPALLGRSLPQTQPKRVFAVTGPCYAIVAYLIGHVVRLAIDATLAA